MSRAGRAPGTEVTAQCRVGRQARATRLARGPFCLFPSRKMRPLSGKKATTPLGRSPRGDGSSADPRGTTAKGRAEGKVPTASDRPTPPVQTLVSPPAKLRE